LQPDDRQLHGPPSIEDLLEQEAFVRRLAMSLLRDSHAAEDLVQETWVRALQSPPRHSASLRGWLARVVHNLASNARVAHRRRPVLTELQEVHARSPSAAETLAQTLLRRELAGALRSLSEAQRSVIVKRHLEDLPPREIARQAAVPVETVRTRYKRGLAQMRARLHKSYGEDGARWMLGLAAGIRLPPPWAGTPASPSDAPHGAGASSAGQAGHAAQAQAAGTQVLKAAALLAAPLVLLGSALVWIGSGGSGGEPVEVARALAPTPALATPAVAVTRSAALEPGPIGRPAKLALRVRERPDGRPAEGVRVRIENASAPDAPPIVVESDRRGQAAIARLDPGTYELRPERGPAVPRTLREGDDAQVELWVPGARAIEGRVVDARGNPVAGAAILVSLPDHPEVCTVVTQSDGQGRFALAAAPTAWVSARADGFADSELLYVDDPVHHIPGRVLVLKLRYPASQLECVVTDENDEAIRAARVRVVRGQTQWSDVGLDPTGWPEIRLDGSLGVNAPAREGTSGGDGAVLVDGLREGTYTLSVTAEGRAPTEVDVDVDPSRPTTVHVSLAEEARVAGQVTLASGRAAEGATVVVASSQPALVRHAVCDRRGRYTIDGLPEGELDVQAWIDVDGTVHGARARIATAHGETASWNALLSPGGAVSGVAESAPGEPLAGWIVAVEREDSIGPHGSPTLVGPRLDVRRATTDAQGRFAVPGCRPGPHLVTLHAPDAAFETPRAWRFGVVPGAEPVRLCIADMRTATLAGRVVAPDGVAMKDLELVVDVPILPRQLRVPLGDDGVFEVPGLPADRFTLRAWGDGVPLQLVAGGRLTPGERSDLGAVTIEPPGYVELLVRRADGSVPESMQVKVLIESSKPLVCSSESPLHGFEFTGHGRVRVGPLPRGRYAFKAQADHEFSFLERLALAPGRTERVELELQPAPVCSFVFRCPTRPRRRGYLSVSLLDPNGRQVDGRQLHYTGDGEKTFGMDFYLPLGAYALEARVDGETRASFEFEHERASGEPREVDLR
jgi:RNA polymerase sigma factor (sigma-70 family)